MSKTYIQPKEEEKLTLARAGEPVTVSGMRGVRESDIEGSAQMSIPIGTEKAFYILAKCSQTGTSVLVPTYMRRVYSTN